MSEKDVWIAINVLRDKINATSNTFVIVSLQNAINHLSKQLF